MKELFKDTITIKHAPELTAEVSQWVNMDYFNRYAVVPISGNRSNIQIPVAGQYNRNAEVQYSASYFKG